MEVILTLIPDVKVIRPKVYSDDRGFFLESYNQALFNSLGLPPFVQDNHSRSSYHVLRGLHYQTEHPQGKLVRVTSGEIFDVAIDIRPASKTFGKWVGMILSEANREMAWIPPGFAHGFLVLSGFADVLYKVTDYYHPPSERSLLWNDPDLGIKWPLKQAPILSEKDSKGGLLCSVFC